MKKLLIIIMSILAIIIFPNVSLAEQDEYVEEKELDISVSPLNIFINVDNLKPGDRVTKVLTVSNSGKQDFSYIFTNSFLTGSEKFYNQLQLVVIDEGKKLYEGNLKDFEKLYSRELASGDSEKLTFKVTIPYELGNEYQGLSSEFQFKLFVEGTLGGVLPVDGPKLPSTATDIFKILVMGTVLSATSIYLFAYQKRLKRKKQDVDNKGETLA
ncbi:TasA family protein [Rossellomorea vietnamensis]|uniref:TasA family protein n=1 Tax=Rossellomorea vietnamensis TaxID=218284 RepID=UPI003CF2E10D